MGVQADWIAIGKVDYAVQIASISYASNEISLKSPMTWTKGAHVWLYKDSSGKRVLFESAPDIGAFEFSPNPPPADSGLDLSDGPLSDSSAQDSSQDSARDSSLPEAGQGGEPTSAPPDECGCRVEDGGCPPAGVLLILSAILFGLVRRAGQQRRGR